MLAIRGLNDLEIINWHGVFAESCSSREKLCRRKRVITLTIDAVVARYADGKKEVNMKWKVLLTTLLSVLVLCSISAYGEMGWWEQEGSVQWNSQGMHDNWRHYYRGLKKLDHGNVWQAEKEFSYYLNHPEIHRHMFGIAHFGLGLLRMKQGKFEEAVDEFLLAVKEDRHPDIKIADKAYMNIGTIYMKKNDYKESVNAYRKAIETNPKNGLAHYYLGLASLRNGDLEAAEKESAEAKKLGVKFSALDEDLKTGKFTSGSGDVQESQGAKEGRKQDRVVRQNFTGERN
jgi:tetratricopeptide (TPR) repeat protein